MLLFLHIPKTAGTSLRVALARQFGKRLMPIPHDLQSPDKPADFPYRDSLGPHVDNLCFPVDEARRYECVAGHYDWGVRTKLPEARVFVLLREPVARCVSQYKQMFRAAVRRGDRIAGGLDFAEVAQHPTLGLAAFLSQPRQQNLQTRYLAGTAWSHGSGPDDETLLQMACDHLQQCDGFGLVEEYADALARLNRTLGLALTSERANKALPGTSFQPSPDQIALLRERNRMDTALYDFARSLLATKTAAAAPRTRGGRRDS